MINKIEPNLRFTEYKESYIKIEFGDIITSSGYGPRFNGNDYDDDGNVKTIRGTDISLEGEIKYLQVPTAKLDDNSIKNHILEDGDLVMITTADCGLTGVFRKQNINYIPSAYAVRIRLNDISNPFYFKYFLQTKIAYNQVDRYIRKATVANLPGSDILKFQFNIPLKKEQDKIASFLSATDNKINQLTKKKVLLGKYKKKLLQEIFALNRRFKDDNGKYYSSWESIKLSDIFEISSGKSKSKFISEDGRNIIVDMGGISSDGKLIANKLTNHSTDFLKTTDLVMPKDDIGNGYIIGKVANITENNKYIFGDHIYRLSLKKGNIVYLKYCINSEQISKELRLKANGTAQISLNRKSVEEQYIGYPCIEEQNKIACFFLEIDCKINQVAVQLDKTKEFKKGLLQQLFV